MDFKLKIDKNPVTFQKYGNLLVQCYQEHNIHGIVNHLSRKDALYGGHSIAFAKYIRIAFDIWYTLKITDEHVVEVGGYGCLGMILMHLCPNIKYTLVTDLVEQSKKYLQTTSSGNWSVANDRTDGDVIVSIHGDISSYNSKKGYLVYKSQEELFRVNKAVGNVWTRDDVVMWYPQIRQSFNVISEPKMLFHIINMDSQPERMTKFDQFPFPYKRFSAEKAEKGYLALFRNHKRIIQEAKDHGEPMVCILEDDAVLFGDKPTELFQSIWNWLINNREKWDIFFGGHSYAQPISKIVSTNPMLVEVPASQTTHFMVINSSIYDEILNHKETFHIDVFFAGKPFRKIVSVPVVARQAVGYSTIGKVNADYTRIFEQSEKTVSSSLKTFEPGRFVTCELKGDIIDNIKQIASLLILMIKDNVKIQIPNWSGQLIFLNLPTFGCSNHPELITTITEIDSEYKDILKWFFQTNYSEINEMLSIIFN